MALIAPKYGKTTLALKKDQNFLIWFQMFTRYMERERGREGNTGDNDKQNKLVSDAFVAAAQTMKLSDDGARKRKGKHSEKKIKFVKYDLHQNSEPVKARTSAADDSSSGESEVEEAAQSGSVDGVIDPPSPVRRHVKWKMAHKNRSFTAI